MKTISLRGKEAFWCISQPKNESYFWYLFYSVFYFGNHFASVHLIQDVRQQ